MSSTCFEPEGSSKGRRLYIQVWYSMFYMHQYLQSCKVSIIIGNVEVKTDCGLVKLIPMHVKHTCIYNRHPEEECSGSKHVEYIIN
jgi:hypothetical protein